MGGTDTAVDQLELLAARVNEGALVCLETGGGLMSADMDNSTTDMLRRLDERGRVGSALILDTTIEQGPITEDVHNDPNPLPDLTIGNGSTLFGVTISPVGS